MLPTLLKFEKELFDRGIKYVAGVDEVGRGPLAGPFVVGAVILDLEKLFELISQQSSNAQNNRNNDVVSKYLQINDSKQLTANKRSLLNEFIMSEAISYSISEVSSEKLDEIGISKATQLLFYNAVSTLNVKPDHVLTDSFEIKKITKEGQTNIKHGDSLSITIAAASIVAKVYRDRVMVELHEKYPVYGFDKHKGYGTKAHIDAIKQHGICEIHRKSFEPVKSFISANIADQPNSVAKF